MKFERFLVFLMSVWQVRAEGPLLVSERLVNICGITQVIVFALSYHKVTYGALAWFYISFSSSLSSSQVRLLLLHRTMSINLTAAVLVIATIILFLLLFFLFIQVIKVNRGVIKKMTSHEKIITKKSEELEQTREQKEWLLKELHHRVRNNMQIILGLLNSQSYFLKEPSAIRAVMDSKHRVQSLALLHRRLYQEDNLTRILMPAYVEELVSYLRENFNTLQIIFLYDMDDLELNVGQAIPVGLWLNEALTNAVKYAFPKGKGGIIRIVIHNIGGSVLLKVEDNGVGIPESVQINHATSLGFILMKGLSEDVDGKFSIFTKAGSCVQLNFRAEAFFN